jgi:hypothetical protein
MTTSSAVHPLDRLFLPSDGPILDALHHWALNKRFSWLLLVSVGALVSWSTVERGAKLARSLSHRHHRVAPE